MNKHFLLFKTKLLLLYEYCKYKFTGNINYMIRNLATSLANDNLFYIKILQGLSSNSELLDNETIDYLSTYTDNVPYEESELKDDLFDSIKNISNKYNDTFTIENKKPIKSGLISVIYEGFLNDKRVIVKVKRKNISDKLISALNDIEFIINDISKYQACKNLQLNKIFNENKELMINQTDFIQEAKNIDMIYNANKNIDYVVVPKIYENYTHGDNDILVMDYIEGETLNNIKNTDKDKYSYLLAKFGLKCIMYDRVYHGDLHQGNILFIKEPVSKNNKSYYKHKLGIIDFGVVGTLSKEEQNTYYNFFNKFFYNKFEECSEYILEVLVEPKNIIDTLADNDKKSLVNDIVNILETNCRETKSFGVGEITYVNKLLNKFDLSLSKSFCKIELAMAIFDNTAQKLTYNTTYVENFEKAIKEMFPDTNDYTINTQTESIDVKVYISDSDSDTDSDSDSDTNTDMNTEKDSLLQH